LTGIRWTRTPSPRWQSRCSIFRAVVDDDDLFRDAKRVQRYGPHQLQQPSDEPFFVVRGMTIDSVGIARASGLRRFVVERR
jgi:hypothetical protein